MLAIEAIETRPDIQDSMTKEGKHMLINAFKKNCKWTFLDGAREDTYAWMWSHPLVYDYQCVQKQLTEMQE